MTLLSAGRYLAHFSFILFLTLTFSSPPSDETEYEYSGSEEEDEERDMGEPRSVFESTNIKTQTFEVPSRTQKSSPVLSPAPSSTYPASRP